MRKTEELKIEMPSLETEEDFTSSFKAFEYVYNFHNQKLKEMQILEKVSAKAAKVGIRNFKTMYRQYVSDISGCTATSDNYTNFDNQPLELFTGTWTANFEGVRRAINGYEELACPHPIMPVERLINIDTGLEKLRIAYKKGNRWKETIADKSTLASASKITNLADYGIAVTSETAKALVKYLSEVENLNFDIIPEKNSFSRLGKINEEGFIPFVDNLVFDGDANYKSLYKAIRPNGSYEVWTDEMRKVRNYSIPARIMLASSFASTLVHPLNAQPFFVHLWSSMSGTGKTVALMCAASVWGNPNLGEYIQTFNSTQVGQERLAAFLNHLPLMIDELQLNNNRSSFNVYQLAEGVGRARGNKYGGIDTTPTWANAILTTGETPLTSGNSGAGALNRVIDIECKASEKIIEDGQITTSIIKNNYGFAGREFVEILYRNDEVILVVQKVFDNFYRELCQKDTTEKQAMASALILTADRLISEWIFDDKNFLTIKDIEKYLATKSEVSFGERGYKFICDWVSINSNKFIRKGYDTNPNGEIYGEILDNHTACIISAAFKKACNDNDINPSSLLSYLKENGLIETKGKGKGTTKGKRIQGTLTECVFLNLPQGKSDVAEDEEIDVDLDF